MKNYITSDLHYNHKNITGPKVSKWTSGYRNFDSISEMNRVIISSINSVVEYHDTLYILGDLAFGLYRELLDKILCNNIIVVLGNHDSKDMKHPKLKEVVENKLTEIDGCKVYLNHYPIRPWNEKHLLLHGHTHHTLENEVNSFDVGWCKYRRPLQMWEILELVDYRV